MGATSYTVGLRSTPAITPALQLHDTIEHESTLDDGSTFWDLQTTENETIAYGVYIFHIEAPGIGEKIGRFAIIR